jgi:hypothetical protein
MNKSLINRLLDKIGRLPFKPVFCMAFFFCIMTFRTAEPAPNWQLVQTTYPISDVFVAGYSVKDFGATGDGVTDVTPIFQKLLDSLRKINGGTLFVPEGKYVIRGTLLIPKGITLRGEWSKPVKGQAIKGTILMAYSGRGNETATPLITMETSAAVRDLAIWYPDQLPGSITPYPPAIQFGAPNYFGNEFCNAKNITLVNAYSGVIFSRTNGGTCPVINGIYGTPLSRGVEIDNIADVGRIEWIDFSPAYWSGSGLPNAPAAGSSFDTWLYQNGTGIVMRRNDWSYVCYVTIEGYGRGEYVAPSIASPGSVPNGHQYAMTFTKCKTAIYVEVVSGTGIMFTQVVAANCDTGFCIGPNTSGTVQLDACSFDVNATAVKNSSSSSTKIMMQQCTFTKGAIAVSGGTLTACDCDFNNAAPQISLGTNARGIITGNRFTTAAQIQNNSQWACAIDQTPVTVRKLPTFPVISASVHQPPRMVMYNAAAAPFGARNDNTTDNTAAIQAALTQASSDGGGVVFLPPGKYKVLGNLTVPTGVELTGSSDVSTAPSGPGSVLEVYAGRGNPAAPPFIKVSSGSGLRGLTFDYPEQNTTQLPTIPAYPYLIQVTGSNAYIINVGIRMAYSGIDLFTYKCDNHFVDFLAGHALKTSVKVGGNSTGGQVNNLQFNISFVSSGSESKWGSWPNTPPSGGGASFSYANANFDFMVLGACQNEILYNDFGYGSQRGLVLASDNATGPTGIALGLGIDGARRSVCIEATGANGYDFINTQLVSLGGSANCDYIETSQGSTAQCTFFSSDYWGGPGYTLNIGGGTLNFQLGCFSQQGNLGFATVRTGSLNLYNSGIWPNRLLLNSGAEPKLSAQSCIIDPTGITMSKCALWKNNLGNSATRVSIEDVAKSLSQGEITLLGAAANRGTRLARIAYALPGDYKDIAKITFAIYELSGRQVCKKSASDGFHEGKNSIALNGGNALSPGIYMIQMSVANKNSTVEKCVTRKMSLLP